MKKIIAFASFLFFFFLASSQPLIGNWEGALSINNMELPIIFHIAKDSTGKLVGAMDSPKQMAYGLKCTGVTQTGDSVSIAMKSLGVQYKGIMASDKKSIGGTFYQGGMELPLAVKKTGDDAIVKEVKRPQTPKPPLGYFSEDIAYSNAGGSIIFGATLTRPMDKVLKKYPAVILITGSGQQDRDETLFEHKPFAVIADYLTKQGIVVLRVDDREKGQTTGKFMQSTTQDFANDVEAGIDYLKTRKEVDVNNIGLIGHSEGGMIAPMVASNRKDVKFIVLLAGPGVPIIDLMQQQSADVAAASGLSKEDVDQYKPLYRDLLSAIIIEKDTAIAIKKATDVFIKWQTKTPEETVKKSTGVTNEKERAEFVSGFVKQLQQPWFNYFIKINPADYLSKVKCAVLALNGEKDIQVAAEPNLEAIRKIMVEKEVKTFKVQALPGLNHLFQHCNKCDMPEYATIEETFSPEALDIIGNWIKGVVKK